jgi:4,5-DOPA dioxygenase extradiol
LFALPAVTMMARMSTPTSSTSSVAPVLFVAHGAPPLLDDPAWIAELAAWGQALPKPRAMLVISAHWEARPLAIGATTPVPLIYDFYGFPQKFYRLQYASPGAPELAAQVRALLMSANIQFTDEPRRGLDHGVYIPLMCMYPAADIPVLQIALPSMEPKELLAVGRALASLRAEGVMIIGSGFITHNLRALSLPTTPGWARDFDAWTTDVLARHDLDALLDYRARAPGVRESLPTHEHFVPVIVAAGAVGDTAPNVTFPISGFWMGGAMTKRSVQYG